MGAAEIQGARISPLPITSEAFDLAHETAAHSPLIWRLAAEAYGADYPVEIESWGMTTWWTLGRCVSSLRVGPGQHLVDLACGRGGPGLWLARATGATLTGVDWSPVAIEAADRRAEAFLSEGRARFQVGDLADTGLPDECADAVVCLDAVFFASDRVAALSEVVRLLRPGRRYVFTAGEVAEPARPTQVRDWSPLLEAAGLAVDAKEEAPRFAEQLGRMYELWLENLDALREEMGEDAARELEEEARSVGPGLADERYMVISAHRPE